MALHISMTLGCCSAMQHQHQRLFIGKTLSNMILSSRTFSSSVLVYSRRRNSSSSGITSSSKKKKKHIVSRNDVQEDDDDLDEDAFEALFRQLEEDLKNDDDSVDYGDDEISEEDLVKLEQELDEALRDDDLLGALVSSLDEDENEGGKSDDEEYDNEEETADDDEDERPVKLKNWQLRRLAYALKKGRRKTSIKSLAAELCLDRAFVLQLLREPPPNLLMLSAALSDKPESTLLVPETKHKETCSLKSVADTSDLSPETILPLETAKYAVNAETKMKVPVHVMQNSWSARKRLKKVQVETLERVYRRTKRPTNAMISSIVHVTNLPRKRIVKWFEEKRAEDGVPDCRLPYQRPNPKSVTT